MPRARIQFGLHEFDPDASLLFRRGERCVLQSQPARLLGLLLEHPGEIVTRDQIRQELWPDTIVAYDQGINFAIRQIRIALGGDADLRREMGVRFALGATRRSIAGLVLREALSTASAGIAAGLLAAVAAVRLAGGALLGVPSLDARAMLLVTLLAVALVVAASLGPAHRAARVDVAELLRLD